MKTSIKIAGPTVEVQCPDQIGPRLALWIGHLLFPELAGGIEKAPSGETARGRDAFDVRVDRAHESDPTAA